MRINGRAGRTQGANTRIVGGQVPRVNPLEGLAAGLHAFGEREQDQRNTENRLALARLDGDARVEFAKTFDSAAEAYDGANPGFADQLRGTLSTRIDEIVGGLDRDRQDAARLSLERLRDNTALQALNVERSRRTAHVQRGITEWGQTAVNAVASDPAQFFGFRENVDDIVAGAPAHLRADLKNQLLGNLGETYGIARIDDDPHDFLDELNGGDLDHVLNGADKQRLVVGAEREIDRRQKAAQVALRKQQAAASAAFKTAIDDIEDAQNLGLPVSQDRLDQLRGLSGLGDERLAGEVNEKVHIFEEAQRVAQLPPLEGQRQVDEERRRIANQGDASSFEVDRLEALTKAVDGKRARVNRDPVAAGIQDGDISPIDFAEIGLETIPARVAQADAYASEVGVAPSYLSSVERDSLAAFIQGDAGGFTFATGLAGTVSGQKLLSEILDREPTLVQLASLKANGVSQSAITDAQRGFARRDAGEDSRIRVRTTASGGGADAQATVGSAFANLPNTGRGVIAVADAIYEERAAKQGLDKSNFDEDLYQRGLQEAAGATYDRRGNQSGGITRYRGREVVVPTWMREDRFRTHWRNLSDEQVSKASQGHAFTSDGVRAEARHISRGHPVAIGNGRYWVNLGDTDDEAFLRGADGRPFEINLRNLRSDFDESQVRRPIPDVLQVAP